MRNRPILKDYNEDEMKFLIDSSLTNNRERKVWTVPMLYKLWIKLKDRSNDRWKQRREVIQEIVEKIIPEKKGNGRYQKDSWVIHDKFEMDGKIMYNKLRIEWDDTWKSYTVIHGSEYVGDVENLTDQREENISEILQGDLQKELGEKYKKVNRLTSGRFQSIVKKYMWEVIESKLDDMKIGEKNGIFKITICGDQYYVTTSYENYPYGLSYELRGRVNDVNIEF